MPSKYPFSLSRIVVATGAPVSDHLKTLAAQGGVHAVPRESNTYAMAGDVWLCPADDRLVVEDELQGQVLAFVSPEIMIRFLMPLLLDKAARQRDHLLRKSKHTRLKEVSIMVQDRGGQCGPPCQVEGVIQALHNEEIAILATWTKGSFDPSWLWFDRATGKCTSEQFACLYVSPAELDELITAAPTRTN